MDHRHSLVRASRGKWANARLAAHELTQSLRPYKRRRSRAGTAGATYGTPHPRRRAAVGWRVPRGCYRPFALSHNGERKAQAPPFLAVKLVMVTQRKLQAVCRQHQRRGRSRSEARYAAVGQAGRLLGRALPARAHMCGEGAHVGRCVAAGAAILPLLTNQRAHRGVRRLPVQFRPRRPGRTPTEAQAAQTSLPIRPMQSPRTVPAPRCGAGSGPTSGRPAGAPAQTWRSFWRPPGPPPARRPPRPAPPRRRSARHTAAGEEACAVWQRGGGTAAKHVGVGGWYGCKRLVLLDGQASCTETTNTPSLPHCPTEARSRPCAPPPLRACCISRLSLCSKGLQLEGGAQGAVSGS
jgi:hypothetical protein